MPFTYIKDTAEVRFVGQDTGTLQFVENVMHAVLADADQSTANVQNMANAVETAMHGQLGAFSGNLQLIKVVVRGLSSAAAPEATAVFPVSTFGTGGAVKDPTACGLVKLLTAKRGRSYRGRIYWGGLPDTSINGGLYTLTSGQVTAYVNLMSAIQTDLGALVPASGLVVASKKLGTSELVITTLVENEIATQRRRLLR